MIYVVNIPFKELRKTGIKIYSISKSLRPTKPVYPPWIRLL